MKLREQFHNFVSLNFMKYFMELFMKIDFDMACNAKPRSPFHDVDGQLWMCYTDIS
jgi:hypothetical protein